MSKDNSSSVKSIFIFNPISDKCKRKYTSWEKSMRRLFIEIIVFGWLAILATSCSLSFSNISTHGFANDLVDQDMKADADIKPNVSIPTI